MATFVLVSGAWHGAWCWEYVIPLLEARGHKIVVGATSGSANSILVTPEGLTGAADPRQRGTLADGF